MSTAFKTLAALIACLFLSIVSARALKDSWPSSANVSPSSFGLDLVPTLRKIVPLSGYFEGHSEAEIRRKATPSCEAKAHTLQAKYGLFALNYSVSIVKSLEVFEQRDHYWLASCVFEMLDFAKIQKIKSSAANRRKI